MRREMGSKSEDLSNINDYTDAADVNERNNLDEHKVRSKAISWYPGHIAKAERELADYLKKVDVVIEVRDARIPLSTTHPLVPEWVGNKPLIVAIARLDQISDKALKEWREYYAMNPAHKERPEAKVYFVDGKHGSGVLTLKKQALKAGVDINEKRKKKGIQPRAVRAAVIGFPNVGKSALINRLLGKTMAKSRNMPGVTRSLQWVRIGKVTGDQSDCIELLDSPGIIPARQFDQLGAVKLAICNDIGEASYDRVVVAGAMCDQLNNLHRIGDKYVNMQHIKARYNIEFDKMTGEEIVYELAKMYYQGNSVSSADKLLGDFRKGLLVWGSLECPKDADTDEGNAVVKSGVKGVGYAAYDTAKQDAAAADWIKSTAVLVAASTTHQTAHHTGDTDSGSATTSDDANADSSQTVTGSPEVEASSTVGKGMYEGW
jgi:ribosome biogenesis GTPase A